jgi:hypothetical protein
MILTSNLQRPNIRGCVDQVVSRFGVSGWAADDQMPERTVVVLFNVDDEVVGNKFRSDLADAGIGSGHHAFFLCVPDSDRQRVTEAATCERRRTGSAAPPSPWN